MTDATRQIIRRMLTEATEPGMSFEAGGQQFTMRLAKSVPREAERWGIYSGSKRIGHVDVYDSLNGWRVRYVTVKPEFRGLGIYSQGVIPALASRYGKIISDPDYARSPAATRAWQRAPGKQRVEDPDDPNKGYWQVSTTPEQP